jgi:hypothetical protein
VYYVGDCTTPPWLRLCMWVAEALPAAPSLTDSPGTLLFRNRWFRCYRASSCFSLTIVFRWHLKLHVNFCLPRTLHSHCRLPTLMYIARMILWPRLPSRLSLDCTGVGVWSFSRHYLWGGTPSIPSCLADVSIANPTHVQTRTITSDSSHSSHVWLMWVQVSL